MTRLRLLQLLLAVLLLWPACAPGATRPELLSAEPDRELLHRIVEEEQIDVRRPRPKMAHYVEALSKAALERMVALLDLIEPGLLAVLRWITGLGWMLLVGLLSVILLVTAGRMLARHLARRRREASGASVGVPVERLAEAVGDDWRKRLEACLVARDIPSALEALWWWLAGRLVPHGADPSWTTRELLRAAQRSDLLSHGRILDRMMYGARLPEVEDVRRVWTRLQEAVS